ncbi:glycosyltransferase [Pontibacter ruber]|uniref:Glycosyltransferase n=1 Tax=Pontibacter ruber TaxID=1343895 RepID=A0ABW5CRC6_9BACT|nr:glycosyltransferase [Pontibacter ruber]
MREEANLKNIKVGYFTQSVAVSETFISDLILGLSEIFSIETYTNSELGKNLGIKYTKISIDYYPNWFVNKLFLLAGGRLRLLFKKKFAYYNLDKKLKNKYLDVAFIEYGTTSVLIQDFLVSRKIPFIVHFHGFDITSSLNDFYYRTELKKVFAVAIYVIAASNHIKRLLILQGCPSSKIKVIKLGIDAAIYEPLPWDQRFKLNPSIAFLGRLTPKKNPIALLHAFKLVVDKLPNTTLSIIGDGPLRKEVELTINSLGLAKSTTLYGALSRDKSLPILNRHWIYAQHSVTSYQGDQEGFAISIAEAAALNIPVVSTLHNGIPENVIDGETGFLVKEYDYEEMANKIILLLEDVELIKRFGEAGRTNVIKELNPLRRIKAISNLLSEIKN